MIAIPTTEGTIKTYGSYGSGTAGLLQPAVTSSRTPNGLQIVLEWKGDYAVLAQFQAGDWCTPGCPGLPDGLAMVDPAVPVKLETSVLALEEGYEGVLRNTYVMRTSKEPEAELQAGLVARTSSMQWVERQEQLEHFAARKTDADLGAFNPVLVEMWRAEEVAAIKQAFQVRLYTDNAGTREYDQTVSLDDATVGGSAITKAVAERIAQGVEYAGQNMLQVIVREVWRIPPALAYACNTVLPQGIPAPHQPLFTLSDFEQISWMRMSDNCDQVDAAAYIRTIVYLGLPMSMMPNPMPSHWGATPFDGMLYKSDPAQP